MTTNGKDRRESLDDRLHREMIDSIDEELSIGQVALRAGDL